jgi:hypothetical protein
VLAAAAVVVSLPVGGGLLTATLFALGYGWNLCYVSGSAALARTGGAERAENRTGLEGPRLESLVEAWAWTVSAAATTASTVLFSAGGGFRLLSLVSLVLLVPLVTALATRRGAVDDDSALRRDAGTLSATPGREDRARF